MKLIDNWRQAKSFLSVHAMVWAGALQGAWMAIPDSMRDGIPKHLVSVLTMTLLALGIAGRLVDQSKKDANPKL